MRPGHSGRGGQGQGRRRQPVPSEQCRGGARVVYAPFDASGLRTMWRTRRAGRSALPCCRTERRAIWQWHDNTGPRRRVYATTVAILATARAAFEAAPAPYARAMLTIRDQAKFARVGNSARSCPTHHRPSAPADFGRCDRGRVFCRGGCGGDERRPTARSDSAARHEIKEARELVAKARHFETQRRRLAGAARPRGGAGRVVIDVAAVSGARKAFVDAVPSAPAGPLADACAALAAGDGAAAGPRLDECLGSANARGAPPGGGPPPRAALLVLKARGVAAPGGRRETNQTSPQPHAHGRRHSPRPRKDGGARAGRRGRLRRLTRRHALPRGHSHGRCDAREASGNRGRARGARSAPKPCTLDEDLRHCSEEAADRAAGMAARDDVAMRLARGERDAPPPPPPSGRRPPPPRSASTNQPPPPPPMGRPAAATTSDGTAIDATATIPSAQRTRTSSSSGSPAQEGSLRLADVPLRRPAPSRRREKSRAARPSAWHPDVDLSPPRRGTLLRGHAARREKKPYSPGLPSGSG